MTEHGWIQKNSKALHSPDNDATSTATTQSYIPNVSLSPTGQAVTETVPTNAAIATSSSSQQVFQVYCPTKLRGGYSNTTENPAALAENNSYSSLPRNSSFEQQKYGYAYHNRMDYSTSSSSRHLDRVSPTHGTGRSSPESESVIYDHASALVTPHGFTKQMLKVYTDEKNSETVKIDEKMKACEVCHMIVRNSGHPVNKNWSIVEVLPKFDLG